MTTSWKQEIGFQLLAPARILKSGHPKRQPFGSHSLIQLENSRGPVHTWPHAFEDRYGENPVQKLMKKYVKSSIQTPDSAVIRGGTCDVSALRIGRGLISFSLTSSRTYCVKEEVSIPRRLVKA